MRSTSVRKRGLTVTAIVALVVALEVWALSVPVLRQSSVDLLGGLPARTVAMRLDLILVVPILLSVIAWAWSGRPAPRLADVLTLRTAWSLTKRYGFLLFIAGLWLLSSGSSGQFVLVLVVLVEIAFFVLLIVKSAALRRQLIQSRKAGYSLTTSVLVAANRSFGALRAGPGLRLALTELALIYQAAFAWMIPRRRQGREFTNNRGEDYTLFIGFLLVVAIEAVPVHFLVHNYVPWLAWVLTGLSAYSFLWILGDVTGRAMRPTVLIGDRLRLSRGLRLEAVLDIREVVSVREADEESYEAADARFGEKPQLIIELRNPVEVYGWFGILAKARLIAVQVDDPEALTKAIEAASGMTLC